METSHKHLPAASNTPAASAGIENVSRPGTPVIFEDPKSISGHRHFGQRKTRLTAQQLQQNCTLT